MKEEQANGRRGAGRDQGIIINQEEVHVNSPIDLIESPSHLLFDCHSSHNYAL